QPKPDVYYRTENGSLARAPVLDTPPLSDYTIALSAERAALDLFNASPDQTTDRLWMRWQHLSNARELWASLDALGFFSALYEKNQIAILAPTNFGVVVGRNRRAPVWVVQFPALLTYRSSSEETTKNVIIQLQIHYDHGRFKTQKAWIKSA
ncbi:MAG: hypothetical protein D6712_13065, partial [Chloroflexi bacterium]